MTRKFSPADFASAKFAEHPDGRVAARTDAYPKFPWSVPLNEYTDESMARDGWVPVPTKPAITESQLARAAAGVWGDGGSGPMGTNGYARGFLFRLGINVDPNPEPSDEELLAGIIRGIDDWQSITSPELLAKYLNTAGVAPPREDDA